MYSHCGLLLIATVYDCDTAVPLLLKSEQTMLLKVSIT